jgi:sulfatase modifying factor 1
MAAQTVPADMIRLPGGRITIGSVDFYPEEAPVQSVEVTPFLLDATPVTNAKFAEFVEDTGFVTLAETVPDPADYPGILPEMIVAGSIVFTAPPRGQQVGPESWWGYVPGANWRQPYGPLHGDLAPADHPVVHVTCGDALAYARWAGKRLPTEIEAEFASRGGLRDAVYAWGDALQPAGGAMANIWHEGFPFTHPERTGPPYTTPVGQYPANGYGLYDLIGNVWEWTSSDATGPVGNNSCCHSGAEPFAANPGRHKVLKGGSHLCAPNYCQRYRPAAKWFQPVDTSTTHVGFRCARSLP